MAETSINSLSEDKEGQTSEDDETQQNISQNMKSSIHHASPHPDYTGYPNEHVLPQVYPTPQRINPNYEQQHYYENRRIEPRYNYNHQNGQVRFYYPRQTEQFVSSYRINYASECHYPMELRGHQSFQNRLPLHHPLMNVPYPYDAYVFRPNDGGGYWPSHRVHPDLSTYAGGDLDRNSNFSHGSPCAYDEGYKRYFHTPSAQYSLNRNTNESIGRHQLPHIGNYSCGEKIDDKKNLSNQGNSQYMIHKGDFPNYQDIQNTSSSQKDDQYLTTEMFLKYMKSMDSEIKKLERKLDTNSSSDFVTSDVNFHLGGNILKKTKDGLLCSCHECGKRYSHVYSPQYSFIRNSEESINVDRRQFPCSHSEMDKIYNNHSSMNKNVSLARCHAIQNASSAQQNVLPTGVCLKRNKLQEIPEISHCYDSGTYDEKLFSNDKISSKDAPLVKLKTPVTSLSSNMRNDCRKFPTYQEDVKISQEPKDNTLQMIKRSGEDIHSESSSTVHFIKPTKNQIQGGCKPKTPHTYNQRTESYQENIGTSPWDTIKEIARKDLNVENFKQTIGPILLDELEKAVKRRVRPNEPEVQSAITGVRNVVEKVVLQKCEAREIPHLLVEDCLPIFLKKKEEMDFVRNFFNTTDIQKERIPMTDYLIQEYESTLSKAQLDEKLSYKKFYPSKRISEQKCGNIDEIEKTKDSRCDEEAINRDDNLDDNLDDNIDDNFNDITGKGAHSFDQRDEDSSSDESYHSFEDNQDMDNESTDLSTLQIIASLENTNNSKYSDGISERTIRFLAKKLGDPQCRQLVKDLGLTQINIDDIETEQRSNASREEIREKWIVKCRQTFGSSLNNITLIKALINVGCAEMVNDLFPDFIEENPQIPREIFSMGKTKLSLKEFKYVLRRMQLCLKTGYAKENVLLPTTPWMQHKILRLDELYVDLKMFPKNNNGFEVTGKEIKLQDIFLKVNGEYPYRILVEGPPGYGKTTFTFKLAVDWAKNEIYLKRFHLVFIIALRYFHGDLEEVMLNECKVENIPDIVKLSVIKSYQKHVLLILDGYDELSDDHKVSLISLLKGNKYSTMTVVLTSRTGLFKLPMKHDKNNQLTGGYVEMSNRKDRHISFCKKRIEIKGISPEKRKLFLEKYLQIDVNNLYSKLAHVMSDEMKNLYECPLVLLLLAMLVEDKGVEQISSKTDLYKQVVNFIVRRSLEKQSLIPHDREVDLFGDIGEEFFDLIMKLGEYSLQKLTQHTLIFSEDEILEHCNNDETVLKLGFLTKNIKLLKHEESEFYEPVHKTFLEFLAALRLWYLHQESEDGKNEFNLKISSLIKQKILDQKDSLLFIFLSGLLEEQSNLLLETLNSWNYNMSAYEYPISDIVKESQCMKKLLPYITPFIPPIFQHHYDFFTNVYNWHVFKAGIHHGQIKVLNLNAHYLTNIPSIGYVEIVQLDIWGKDIENEFSVRRTFSITCKELICWFYEITERNWNYYAHVIRRINAEHVNLVVNANDDYKQMQLILTCINEELRNGQWQHLNIKFLKVLGLDGKNDRQSLNLIGNIINSKMIKKGLVVVIKSIVGELETLTFWFKTQFLKPIKEVMHKFERHLQLIVSFKDHLKSDFEKIIFEIHNGIQDVVASFESTVRKLDRTINFASPTTSYERDYERGDVLKVPYKKGVTEDRIKWFAKVIKRNGYEFLKEFESLLISIESDTSQLCDSCLDEIRHEFEGFLNFMKSAETDILDEGSDDSDITDNTIVHLDKVIKSATYILQNSNPFKSELEIFLNIIYQSGLVNFTLNNGYCNTMHPPSLDPRKCFRKEWEVLQLGDKIVIDDSYYKAVGEYRIKDLALTDGREKYAEKDVSAILKCIDLQSLSSTTMLLKKLQSTENKDWKGFTTLKKLSWILDDQSFEDKLQVLQSFKSLEYLSIRFGCISKKFKFDEFPHVPFQSLKALEITEVDYENIDFVKDLTRHLLNKEMIQRSADKDEVKVEIQPLELKLNLSKIFDDKDIEEIYDITKELLLANIIRKLMLIDPNESQIKIIMKVFSFIKYFHVTKTIEGFDDKEMLFAQPDKSCSSDIRIQMTVCKL